MNLPPLTKTRQRVETVSIFLTTGLRRSSDDRMTWRRVAVGFVLPALVAGLAVGSQISIPGGQLLSGVSVVSGVLLALCTLSFNRVKDLGGDDQAWDGIDPMIAAYRFARSALATTYVSLTTTGLLIVQLFITGGLANSLLLGTTLGLLSHLGVRLWLLLGSIRHQVESVAGQRSVAKPQLREAG